MRKILIISSHLHLFDLLLGGFRLIWIFSVLIIQVKSLFLVDHELKFMDVVERVLRGREH